MVASALSSLDGVGKVNVDRQATSTTAVAATWSYSVTFVSMVGNIDELVVGAGNGV